jgi:hypothetical protein
MNLNRRQKNHHFGDHVGRDANAITPRQALNTYLERVCCDVRGIKRTTSQLHR